MWFSIHGHIPLTDFSGSYKQSSDNEFLPYLKCHPESQLQKEKGMEQVGTTGLRMDYCRLQLPYVGLPSLYHSVWADPLHFSRICSSFMEFLGLIGMKLKIINITKKFNCNWSIDERQSPVFLLRSVNMMIQLKPTELRCYLHMLLRYLHVLPTFPMVFQHVCPLLTWNIILFFALCS